MGKSARPGIRHRLFLALLLCVSVATFALGCWQWQRRSWKHELIARVEAGLSAAPAPLPEPASWSRTDWSTQEYRRIEAIGNFDFAREILVRGSSELGTGYWVMTPMQLSQGACLLVNRGFVPMGWRDTRTGQSTTPERVVGLLRTSRPRESWWRHNDPAHGIWVARDVAQLAAAMDLDRVAPFFMDEGDPREASGQSPGNDPAQGLTVLHFPDNHLQYALTWFALAAAALLGAARVWRERMRETGA